MQSPALDLIVANPRITGLNLFTKWISLSIILIRDEFKWLKCITWIFFFLETFELWELKASKKLSRAFQKLKRSL